jgi:hypothetical protein
MMSFIIKTTGHNRTPADRLNEISSNPKREMFTTNNPKVFSRENISIPINSANNALAT